MGRMDKQANPSQPPQPGAVKRPVVKGTKGDQAREARIKAALKANIARRKEQAKVRDIEEPDNG